MDTNTRVLARSKKMDSNSFENEQNSWSFSHLTLQELVAAHVLFQDMMLQRLARTMRRSSSTFARCSTYEAGQFWLPVISCGLTSIMERTVQLYQVLREFVGVIVFKMISCLEDLNGRYVIEKMCMLL